MAAELRALGLNVDCAPLIDVRVTGAHDIIGDRAFGETAAAVGARALAFLAGLESRGGLRGCGKHFPGHGDTETDSHLTLPVVRRDLPALRAVELGPFVDAVAGPAKRRDIQPIEGALMGLVSSTKRAFGEPDRKGA